MIGPRESGIRRPRTQPQSAPPKSIACTSACAIAPCGTPKPRKAPLGGALVITARPSMRTWSDLEEFQSFLDGGGIDDWENAEALARLGEAQFG